MGAFLKPDVNGIWNLYGKINYHLKVKGMVCVNDWKPIIFWKITSVQSTGINFLNSYHHVPFYLHKCVQVPLGLFNM